MDRALGPFIEWLKESGRYDRTTIVLTSDHGEEFYEHGGWWHGTALYGESTHVPLIIKLPEQELASKRVPWSALESGLRWAAAWRCLHREDRSQLRETHAYNLQVYAHSDCKLELYRVEMRDEATRDRSHAS